MKIRGGFLKPIYSLSQALTLYYCGNLLLCPLILMSYSHGAYKQWKMDCFIVQLIAFFSADLHLCETPLILDLPAQNSTQIQISMQFSIQTSDLRFRHRSNIHQILCQKPKIKNKHKCFFKLAFIHIPNKKHLYLFGELRRFAIPNWFVIADWNLYSKFGRRLRYKSKSNSKTTIQSTVTILI